MALLTGGVLGPSFNWLEKFEAGGFGAFDSTRWTDHDDHHLTREPGAWSWGASGLPDDTAC